MNQPLIIYGAGGLGKEIFSLLLSLRSEWEVIGFCDDGLEPQTEVKAGLRVLGGLSFLLAAGQPTHVVVAVGSPISKMRLVDALRPNGQLSFPSLVHPSAILLDRSNIKLKPGSIICAGCILTTDIVVGAHTLINLNCTVGHDVSIGDCTSIMPGVNVAGEVKIGNGVLIGSGTNVINRLSIGDRARIGAGAAVIHSIPSDVTAVGVPARVMTP